MNNRRTQNSLLFITTLGVYLGLVLVGGAAPQVFAHSAITRNFEILDEIEVTDDLDRKPDDEVSTLSQSLGVYLQDIEYFLSDLRRLREAGKFDPKSDSFTVAQSTLLPCVKENRVGSYTAVDFSTSNEQIRPWLETFSKRLTDGYSLADCLPSERFNGGEATSSNFKFRFDKSGLAVEVAVKKQSRDVAGRLYLGLTETFRQFASTDADAARSALHRNTAFRTSNDQVFVVTMLPRGSLDSLFGTDAK